MSEEKLPESILTFVAQSARAYGRLKARAWEQELQSNCLELGFESPPEMILYCALKTVRELLYIGEPKPIEDGKGGRRFSSGISIDPQHKIGNYRIDIFLTHIEENKTRSFAVEVDGQAFHERTEEERQYEKRRDGFLISKGITPLHFTATEILKNSVEVAREIFRIVTGSDDLWDTEVS